jgi:hypothetical protein
MQLFDFIKIIFTNSDEYDKCTKGEKRKQYFMCQRRFSINFPMQANALQHLKINQAAVIDFWHLFLQKQYKHVPGWMYTKGIKKAKKEKENKQHISEKTINTYCKYFKIDRKSIYDALEFYPDEILKELKDFEKMINEK